MAHGLGDRDKAVIGATIAVLALNFLALQPATPLRALNNGVPILPETGDGHRSVAAAVAGFLEETELTKKPKTLAAYTTALNYFSESCRKLCLHEIERYDLLKFVGFLRDEKQQSPRSVYNKFETVMTFLKANGIRGLVGKNDRPRYTRGRARDV